MLNSNVRIISPTIFFEFLIFYFILWKVKVVFNTLFLCHSLHNFLYFFLCFYWFLWLIFWLTTKNNWIVSFLIRVSRLWDVLKRKNLTFDFKTVCGLPIHFLLHNFYVFFSLVVLLVEEMVKWQFGVLGIFSFKYLFIIEG